MHQIQYMKSTYFPLVLLSLFVTLFFFACAEDKEGAAKKKGQEIWFEEYVHDYGQIEKDGDGTWSFEFKNIGEFPIVVSRVRSTCGCTVPDWSREPIEPGESGKIKVVYNTEQTGTFLKSLYVYSSAANSPVKLQVKGKVVAGVEENPSN